MHRDLLGMLRRLPLRASGAQGRRARLSLVLAGLLFLVALLGLTTDLFRTPRSIARDSLTRLGGLRETELRFLVDIQTVPDPSGRQFTHAQFRAGPGVLLRPDGERPRITFPFRLILERKAVTLSIPGSVIIRDGVWYVHVTEVPAIGLRTDILENRWLRVGDPPEEAPRLLTEEEHATLVRALLSSAVTEVRTAGREDVLDTRTRLLDLTVDDARLRALLRELPEHVSDHGGLARVAAYIDGRLEQFRVSLVRLWVRPRRHELVRARIELTPREEGAAVRRVVLDATLTPASGQTVPDAPPDAIRIRPETLERLFAR